MKLYEVSYQALLCGTVKKYFHTFEDAKTYVFAVGKSKSSTIREFTLTGTMTPPIWYSGDAIKHSVGGI